MNYYKIGFIALAAILIIASVVVVMRYQYDTGLLDGQESVARYFISEHNRTGGVVQYLDVQWIALKDCQNALIQQQRDAEAGA